MGDKPSGLRLTSTTRHHRTSGLPHLLALVVRHLDDGVRTSTGESR
jgi:hypothetical protein